MAKLDPEPVPGFAWNIEGGRQYFERTKKKLQELIDKASQLRDQQVVGAVLRFPIADGYAFYLVTKERPLTLKHIPVGDAWEIPDAHMRGLTKKDILLHAKRERRLAELFRS
jgi:hypothetical protein